MTISENIFQKSKRGRPTTWDHAEIERIYDDLALAPVGERSRLNLWLSHLGAKCLLRKESDFRRPRSIIVKRWGWLLRFDKHGDPHPRVTMTAQLGRIKCPLAVRIFADRLGELKPATAQALKLIRKWEDWRGTRLVNLLWDLSGDQTPLQLLRMRWQAAKWAVRKD